MQTTLRINDEVYRRAKAKSGELGLSITRFFEEAIQERLEKLEKRSSDKMNRSVCGKANVSNHICDSSSGGSTKCLTANKR